MNNVILRESPLDINRWEVVIDNKETLTIDEYWDKYVCKGTEYSEPTIEDDYIVDDSFLYLKDITSVQQVVKAVSLFEEGEPEYDEILSQGRGWASSTARERIVGKEGAYIVRVGTFEEYKIRPMTEFYNEYPSFNIDNYRKLMNAFDEYYK